LRGYPRKNSQKGNTKKKKKKKKTKKGAKSEVDGNESGQNLPIWRREEKPLA